MRLFLWFGRGELGGIHVPIVLAVVVALDRLCRSSTRPDSDCTRSRSGAARRRRAPWASTSAGSSSRSTPASDCWRRSAASSPRPASATARQTPASCSSSMSSPRPCSAAPASSVAIATVGGSVAGALFINFVRNGLNLLGVNPFWVQVVTGVILLLAVLVNTVVNRRVAEWARLAGAEPEPAARRTRREPALVTMRGIGKTFGAVRALPASRLRGRPWRDRRLGRRQCRRQVDPDEGPERGLHARCRRDPD